MIPKPGECLDLLSARRPIGLAARGRILVETCLLPALDHIAAHCIRTTQFGFTKGSSCIQAQQIIKYAIEHSHVHQQNLYILYVDFADAYTSVEMPLLAATLKQYGMDTKVIDHILHLHQIDMHVQTWYGPSPSFKQSRGLIQGSAIAPALFNIFVEPLSRKIDTALQGVQISDACTIRQVDYADDKAICCSSPEEVEAVINILEKWQNETGMKIKIKSKSKTAISSLVWRTPNGSHSNYPRN